MRVAEGGAPRHPWLLGLSLASAVCAVLFVMATLSWSDLPDRSLYADLAMIPIGVAATVVARSAALAQKDERSRWGWRLMAAGFACFCAGDVLFFVYRDVLGQSPFPSLADAGYLAYYPLMFAGLLFMPRGQERKHSVQIRSICCAVLLLGGGAAVLQWLLLPSLESAGSERLTFALSVGYPVGDLFLLMGVTWALLRRMTGRRATIALLTAGVCIGLAADLVYGYQSLHGTSQPGGASDALYLLSWGLYAWGAYAEAAKR